MELPVCVWTIMIICAIVVIGSVTGACMHCIHPKNQQPSVNIQPDKVLEAPIVNEAVAEASSARTIVTESVDSDKVTESSASTDPQGLILTEGHVAYLETQQGTKIARCYLWNNPQFGEKPPLVERKVYLETGITIEDLGTRFKETTRVNHYNTYVRIITSDFKDYYGDYETFVAHKKV